jgi:hypothetical protein
MSRLDRLELSQTAPILENLEKPSAVGSIIPIIAAELDLTSTADTKKIFLEKVLAIHRQLVNNTHLKEDELGVYRNKDSKAFEELSKMINAEVKKLILADHPQLSLNERSQLQEAVLSEIFGFGPIDTLINNPEYSEIMVNGADHRILFIRLVRISPDQCTVLVGLKIGEPDDHLMRERRGGDLSDPFGETLDVKRDLVIVPDGRGIDALFQFRVERGIIEQRMRVNTDLRCDDEFLARESYSLVREVRVHERGFRTADIHLAEITEILMSR